MPTEWLYALAGGALIGLSAAALMFFNGRIAGISGIFGGLLRPTAGEVGWRSFFVAGLLAGGVVTLLMMPEQMAFTLERPTWALVGAGLMVGFGTRLGSGCTSGHGVCGITRLSPRSITATLTFIATGAGMVVLTRALGVV